MESTYFYGQIEKGIEIKSEYVKTFILLIKQNAWKTNSWRTSYYRAP